MKWTFKITKMDKLNGGNVDIGYTLYKDGKKVYDSAFTYDASGLGLFNIEHLIIVLKEKILAHAYPDIAKEILCDKAQVDILNKEMEIENADISA